jgi:hypothetical protein
MILKENNVNITPVTEKYDVFHFFLFQLGVFIKIKPNAVRKRKQIKQKIREKEKMKEA